MFMDVSMSFPTLLNPLKLQDIEFVFFSRLPKAAKPRLTGVSGVV